MYSEKVSSKKVVMGTVHTLSGGAWQPSDMSTLPLLSGWESAPMAVPSDVEGTLVEYLIAKRKISMDPQTIEGKAFVFAAWALVSCFQSKMVTTTKHEELDEACLALEADQIEVAGGTGTGHRNVADRVRLAIKQLTR